MGHLKWRCEMCHSICPNCGIKVDEDNIAEKERERIEEGSFPTYAHCKRCWEFQDRRGAFTPPKRVLFSEGEYNKDDNTPERWEKMSRIRPSWYGKQQR